MKNGFYRLLLLLPLAIISSTSLADGGSLASRMTAALGRFDLGEGPSIPSKTPDCKLVVINIDPEKAMTYIILRWNSDASEVTFAAPDNRLKVSNVGFRSVYAETEDIVFQDTQRHYSGILKIDNLPTAGLNGATITITENGVAKTCQF